MIRVLLALILLVALDLPAFATKDDDAARAAVAVAIAQLNLRTPAKPVPVVPVATTRAPIGHTHTCANGHTWDHTANSTHTCPICGLSQYVVDQPSRMVNVGVATKTVAAAGCPCGAICPCVPMKAGEPWDFSKNCGTYTCPANGGAGVPVAASPVYSLGGCANGSCGVPAQSQGWYLGKRLGR